MPFITREDGERFVIPSYRDVIAAKNASNLKKEINLLCKSYGEYITLQKINPLRFEAAFSPDKGYLLGESIWHQLKRPSDLIYCEAIPNTTDAILVIVKEGSVYLDGRFSLESIPEELIIFLTQQNNFEIYVYGNVPISQMPTEGKFSFEASSVKSFTELEKPLFPTLPLLKIYQLQLVEAALAAQGIGIVSTQKIVVGIVIAIVIFGMWEFMSSPKEAVTQIITAQINPYQGFEDSLTSPAPDAQLNNLVKILNVLLTMPGWTTSQIEYKSGNLTAIVTSKGTSIGVLQNWATRNKMQVDLTNNAIKLSSGIGATNNRVAPTTIYPLKQIIISLTDKLSFVYPGNVLKLGRVSSKGPYAEQVVSISIQNASAAILMLIANQLKDLPLVLQTVTLNGDRGFYSGTVNLNVLGSQ